jgi:hypothetical protein
MSAIFFLVKILYITAAFGVATGYASESPEKSAATGALYEPELPQSLETIERKVYAVGRTPSGLMIAPDRENFVITTPFISSGTTRELTFGKMLDSKRTVIGDKSELYDWRAFFPLENRVLAFEGRLLTMVEFDSTNLTEIIKRSIQWDKVKPPRDRGGEATTVETSQFRAAFKKAMNATNGLKSSGIAPIPKSWINNGKTNYFMLSRLERFPLLLMECDIQTPSSCVVTRGCNVEMKFKTKVSDLRGIGISETRKQIVVGDPIAKEIHVFKFNSCYSIQHTISRALPKKIKTLSNLMVDSEERLFITTEGPDDYLNASLYFWNNSQW